jgi:general secretion pathway protein K
MKKMTGVSKSNQSGFAIVAAIWLSGLALLVATEFSLRVRTNTLLSASNIRSAELSAVASGMIRLTAWRLSKGQEMLANAEPMSCKWNDNTDAWVSVQDHAGLVDLNVADVSLYRMLFEGLQIGSDRARKLADEVIDYRDVDNIAQTGGPEILLRNGELFKNAPFETVEEIDLLPSMSDELYWKLKPLMTTLSSSANIDSNVMPADLKLIVSLDAERMKQYFALSTRRAFRITTTVKNKSDATYTLLGDVLLIQQPDRPFSILAWNTSARPIDVKAGSATQKACFN